MLINALLFFVVLLVLISLVLARKCSNLSQLAFRDPLTGLHNSHYLQVVMTKLKRKAKKGGYFCGLFIDLDNLKNINDKHSHDAGDMALKKIAEELAFLFPHSIIIRRYRGDEFIVLFHTESQKNTDLAYRKTSDIFSSLFINYAGKELEISASVGKYCLQAKEERVVEKILQRADEEMLISKRNKKAGG